MEKTQKGLVKGIQSGDCILISGKIPKTGDGIPEEHIIYLTGVQAPRCGNSSRPADEEAYGWEARDFLRKLLLGKVVTYKSDFISNERMCGQVFFEGNNVAVEIIKNGLAKVGHVPKGNEAMYKSQFWQSIQEAETQAKTAAKGVWSNDSAAKHKRVLRNITDDAFDIDQIKKLINNKTEIDVIVDYVFNAAFVSLYIPSLSVFTKMNLRFIAIPNSRDTVMSKAGKAYVERTALHHDAKAMITSIDDGKTLTGDLTVAGSTIPLAGSILKNGYAKLFISNTIAPTSNEISLMRSYQDEAKRNHLHIWKNEPYVDESKISAAKMEEDEIGNEKVKCYQVHSGDSISVITQSGTIHRVFLSNLKAPMLAKPNSDESDQPWAFQAKEYLRKGIVGKELKCVYDYAKTIAKEGAPTRRMKFYTVYYNKGDDEVCANVVLLENGLASLAVFKIEEGEPSKELDAMRTAELKAKEKKCGLHSNKNPPNANYSDLISSNKNKKKEFTSFVTGLSKTECVVEYCFSGSKFKLRIEKKRCMIPVSLIGIKTCSKDKNNADILSKYCDLATNYVNENILQREGICDIIAADRVGNYFGHLYINKKNFATELVKQGLAVVLEQSANPNPFVNEMRQAEEEAKKNKLGIWKEEGLGAMLKRGGDSLVTTVSTTKFKEENKDVKVRVTEQIDFHNFYVNIMPNESLSKIEKVLNQYDTGKAKCIHLELPIKVGTLCAAKYSEDERYYRAIVRSRTKDNNFEVEFIDYGNVEILSQNDLIKLDGSISAINPQGMLCEMAYLKYSNNSMKKLVNKYVDFINIDVQLNAKICYTYSDQGVEKYGVILYQKNSDLNTSYHADFLKIGHAKLDRKKNLPQYMKGLDAIENKAKEEGLGLWAENEETDYGMDENERNDY